MDRLDLEASRNETWRPTIDYAYSGGDLPLDGATIRMQWRLYEGADGLPLVDITNVPFSDFAATDEDIAAGAARTGDRILRLAPAVVQATLASLPTGLNQPEAGEADRYSWDATITYSDGRIDIPMGGYVFLNKGVTHA